MTRNRIPSGRFVWLLLAAALLLRAAVPVGWMPASDEDGFRIALCSGAGVVELPVASSGKFSDTGDRHEDGARHDPCPYGAALGSALDVPPAPLITLAPAAQVALTGPVMLAARLTARDSLRPPARGPPELV